MGWGSVDDLRGPGCEAGYIRDPWELYPTSDEACNLPDIYLRVMSPTTSVIMGITALYTLYGTVWLVNCGIHNTYPMDVSFMVCNCLFNLFGSAGWGHPANIAKLEQMALPFGFAWVVFTCGLNPGLFQAAFFRETLKAVVILDPFAERSLDLLLNRASAIMMCSGAFWAIPIWLFSVVQNRAETNALKIVIALAATVVCGVCSATCTRIYVLLSHQPKSALAYGDVFPEHKKTLRRMRIMLMTIAIGYGAISLAFIPVLLLLSRRYYFTVANACCLSVTPVFFLMGYLCKTHHHQPPTASSASASAVQHLPAKKASSTADWKPSHISEVTDAFCSDVNSKVVTQFESQQEVEKSATTMVDGGDHKTEITDITRRRVSHCSTAPRSFTPPQATVAKRGVSLQFLKQFVSEFGVEKVETTHSVVKRLIKKHTEPVSRSYHSMLGKGQDKYGNRWCGEQSVFVSHSWGCPFDTLVRVCTEFERKNPNRRGTYYFIDIFVMNQHSIDTMKNDDLVYRKLLSSLDDSLRASNMILVVLNQYAAPEALTRIWCLFEIWRSTLLGKNIQMGFTKQEAARFARAVHAAEINIDELTEPVDAASAQASDPYDLAMIRRSIESSIGEDQFNEDLRKKLMAHLVDCAINTKFERRHGRHRVMPLPATWTESAEVRAAQEVCKQIVQAMPASGNPVSLAGELRTLADLHTQGALTDTEFAEAKKITMLSQKSIQSTV